MQLFYYLYIVVVVIPFKQIKVMMLKAYSLLLKQEILLTYPTNSLLEKDTIVTSGLTTTTIGTGTTGDTTTIIGSLTTGVGTTLITGVGIITLIIIAIIADRWLNQKQGLESMDLEDE